ncbi:MAG: sugar-binding protein [Armatimonadota bacterium]|nr:sugar-binding protein [Armatimonadota bacterium]
MRRLVLVAMLIAVWVVWWLPCAWSGPLLPQVEHGTCNLSPQLNTASHAVYYWQGRVYVGGAATSGAGPNVWSVNVTNPDSMYYENSIGTGYKAYEIKAVDDKLYVANWSTLLRIHDISSGITQLGEYWQDQTAGWNLDYWVDRVYLGNGIETGSSLYVFDVSNPSSPTVRSILPMSRVEGIAARGSYLYVADQWDFKIINASDDQNPYVMSALGYGKLLGGVRLRDNYAYVYWADIYGSGGFYVIDISNPTSPAQVGSYEFAGCNDLKLLGNYAFYSTGGNGFMTVDISNPASMGSIAQSNNLGLELSITGNGRYVYTGNLYGEPYQGTVVAWEVLDADPDDAGPGKWSSFSPTQTSHDTQYLGDAMPTSAGPAWTLFEGSESYASVQGDGTLRINDNSTASGSKVKWIRSWNATNHRGATVVTRARCASSAGTSIPDIIIEDGKYTEEISILSNKVKANLANVEYALDGTQWHVYRITTSGNQLKVYVDEAPTAVLTATLATTTNRARICFGSGSSANTQDIYYDYFYCFADGSRGPGATTTDTTPDVSVDVADTEGKGSLSGIDPSSAGVQWSTDGGQTWKSSSWETAYDANALPSVSTPSWAVAEGSEVWASVNAGELRVNDTSTGGGTKIKWSRNWHVNPAVGSTVLARARCAATGGDTTYMGNIFVEDGSRLQTFKIYTDRLVAYEAAITYYLDATQYHTYRVTTKGTDFSVYVDENATPVMTGALATGATNNRVMFGGGGSAATQDIYFDYVYFAGAGAFAPGAPAVAVTCTGAAGDDRGRATAYGVPFNQYSETQNQVRLSLLDVVGNRGLSPVYTVRITSPGAPGPVTNFTATPSDGQNDLSWTNPTSAQFTGTMVRFKTTGYPTGPTDGTLLCDKANTPGSNDSQLHSGLTNGTTYYYSAYAHDSVPNYSSAAQASAVPADVTAPGNVTSFTATSGDTQNSLSWANPGDADFAGVVIRFRTDTYPTGPTDGTQCYSGTGTGTNHTGLTNGTTYYYKAFAFDEVPNYASGAQSSAVPADVTAPGNVTSFTATSGDTQNSLSWVNPGDVDFAGVKIMFKTTGYPTGPADGTQCYSGAGTSTNHTGLTNGTTYYYKAFAFDEVPNYASGAQSSAVPADVTPPGPVTGFTATGEVGENELAWTNPGGDFTGTKIMWKTTGYPTGPTDGTMCYDGALTSYYHTNLTNGVTYYYCAYAHDEVPNYASAAQGSATPHSGTGVLNVKVAGAITIDGATGDWSLADFTTTARGGQGETGDIALVGYDGGTVYRGSYVDSLPTSSADHLAKVYSRHDFMYHYFLVRCDDSDIRYPNAVDMNWANDCVEFYIDPSHDHGASPMSNSTSDIQLVIDANNQKNVYMCTTGYASQVLAGVTSAVVRDGTGWWCEVRIAKTALDPDLPNSGAFGVDFNFRDNDNNNDPALTTVYIWNDPSGTGFPSKIPDNWGDTSVAAATNSSQFISDTIPATMTAGQQYPVTVTMKNTGNTTWTYDGLYKLGAVDDSDPFANGRVDLDPSDVIAPNQQKAFSFTMTAPTTPGAYTTDWRMVQEYIMWFGDTDTKVVQVNPATVTISNSPFNSNADGWTISVWRSGPYADGTMAWNSGAGNPGGGMRSAGSGSSDNTDRCAREGGEIKKNISTAGYSNISIQYDLDVNSLGTAKTGTGGGTCAVDHNLIDEQLTVFYSTNGGSSWTEAEYLLRSSLLASYQNWGTRTISLVGVPAVNNNANFWLRFRWQFNQSSDQGNLDNIKVTSN